MYLLIFLPTGMKTLINVEATEKFTTKTKPESVENQTTIWYKQVHQRSDYVVWFAGPLFTKRTDYLPLDPEKSRSREFRIQTFRIALKFGSSAIDMPIKFRRDTVIIKPNLMALGPE